jgi:opacity protein-like surface antigen
MKKSVLAAIAISTPAILIYPGWGSVLAADLAFKTPPPAPFSWSSCYFGLHGGGSFASTDITDPVALAQGSAASATTTVSPSGAVVGGQLGCDYQFARNWVVGIEGSASGSTMKGSTTVGLPAGFPGDQALVSSNTDFLPSVTGRLGYAIDRTMLYGKAGVAWASNKYVVAGSFQGSAFDFEGFDTRTGWTAGAGVDWAFSRHWSLSLEYDYYSFGRGTAALTDSVSGLTGQVDTRQSIQVVKAGVNFHMWSGW